MEFGVLGPHNVRLTCVKITKDFENFHVFGKNQTCVGITTDYLNFRVCGFIHTCVVFTTYLDLSKCLVKTTYVCVFPNTGWLFLYLYLYWTNIIKKSNILYISVI